MRGDSVRIEGLKEFVKLLREQSPEFSKELGTEHRKIARMIRDESKSKAQSLGSVAAKTAPSIRASGTQRSARIIMDGVAFPFAFGAEFGAKDYLQFKPWLGCDEDTGYFLFPTIRAHEDDIAEELMDAFFRVAHHAFPD